MFFYTVRVGMTATNRRKSPQRASLAWDTTKARNVAWLGQQADPDSYNETDDEPPARLEQALFHKSERFLPMAVRIGQTPLASSENDLLGSRLGAPNLHRHGVSAKYCLP